MEGQPSIRFSRLEVAGWRQFGSIDIALHPRLTVLTGANGAGKTTLLGILSQHFGWGFPVISTPLGMRGGILRYLLGLARKTTQEETGQPFTIGRVVYDNAAEAILQVPGQEAESYTVSVNGAQPVPGIFIPSHRPIYFYQRVTEIPTTLSARQQLLDVYLTEVRTRYGGGHTGRSPSSRLKEALISLATFGYGNEAVEGNPEAVRTFEGFSKILGLVLPPTIGFERLAIRIPDVVFQTRTGEFAFDAMSGGMAAILDLAWQIYMRSLIDEKCVAVIDEPENHLHPSLQQSLLPRFLEAFPEVQFVVATHNPFVVTSVPDSHVYVLRYQEHPERVEVESALLDTANKAGTANEVLRDVLGLPFTLPLWVARELDDIVERYAAQPLSEDMLTAVRREMQEMRLEDLYPQTLARLLDPRDE